MMQAPAQPKQVVMSFRNMFKSPDVYRAAIENAANPSPSTTDKKTGLPKKSSNPVPFYREAKYNPPKTLKDGRTSTMFPYSNPHKKRITILVKKSGFVDKDGNIKQNPTIVSDKWEDDRTVVLHRPTRIMGPEPTVRGLVDRFAAVHGGLTYDQSKANGQVYTYEGVIMGRDQKMVNEFAGEVIDLYRRIAEVNRSFKVDPVVKQKIDKRKKAIKEDVYRFVTMTKIGSANFAQFNTEVLDNLLQVAKAYVPAEKPKKAAKTKKVPTTQDKFKAHLKRSASNIMNTGTAGYVFLGNLEPSPLKEDARFQAVKGVRRNVPAEGSYRVYAGKYVFPNDDTNVMKNMTLLQHLNNELTRFAPNDERQQQFAQMFRELSTAVQSRAYATQQIQRLPSKKRAAAAQPAAVAQPVAAAQPAAVAQPVAAVQPIQPAAVQSFNMPPAQFQVPATQATQVRLPPPQFQTQAPAPVTVQPTFATQPATGTQPQPFVTGVATATGSTPGSSLGSPLGSSLGLTGSPSLSSGVSSPSTANPLAVNQPTTQAFVRSQPRTGMQAGATTNLAGF